MTEHGIEVPSIIGTTRLGPIGIEELDQLLEQAYLKGFSDGADQGFADAHDCIPKEYGWAGDAQANTFYDTLEEAEEYMGEPKLFQRRSAGPWEQFDNSSEGV